MGSVEQIIIIKKNGGREGEIFECSGSTTRQKKTAPKSFAHFQFPPPFFKARFSLCVVWAHDVHRRRKHKTTKSPRGTNSLASGKREQNRYVFLVPRQRFSGQGEGCLGLSLSKRKQKGKRKLLGSGGGDHDGRVGTPLSRTSPTLLPRPSRWWQQAFFPRGSWWTDRPPLWCWMVVGGDGRLGGEWGVVVRLGGGGWMGEKADATRRGSLQCPVCAPRGGEGGRR